MLYRFLSRARFEIGQVPDVVGHRPRICMGSGDRRMGHLPLL